MSVGIARRPLLGVACLAALALTACGGGNGAEDAGESAEATLDTAMSDAMPSDIAPADAALSDANMADSSAGALAGTKATNKEVREKLGVTPEPPATDPLKPLAVSEMTALKSAAKGAEFDRVYIEQARPVIEKHLEQAEAIQSRLGETTS